MSGFSAHLITLGTIDSTNEEIKRRVGQLENGDGIMAVNQLSGKGRFGREFESFGGKSLCLSVYYDSADPLITAQAAVCVCNAIEKICGFRPQIKWPNDIMENGKKLCGILAESAGHGMVLGIGLNISQKPEDFSEKIRHKAASLKMIDPRLDTSLGGKQAMAEEILTELKKAFLSSDEEKKALLDEYRLCCITVGNMVRVRFTESQLPRIGSAERINDDFTLAIRWADGTMSDLGSGEVQIRGINGYI